MARPKTVEWLNRALLELFEVAVYIQQEFGPERADSFVVEAYEKVETQAKYPESGRPSKRFKTIRYVMLGKYHRIYYRVHGSVLYVIALFDTRQDPTKDLYR